jgi:hypothetical protein
VSLDIVFRSLANEFVIRYPQKDECQPETAAKLRLPAELIVGLQLEGLEI